MSEISARCFLFVGNISATICKNLIFKIFYLVRKVFLICAKSDNGVINVVDATLVQKYIVGLEEFDDYTLKIADTNGDGTISVIDATNIQKKIVNLL